MNATFSLNKKNIYVYQKQQPSRSILEMHGSNAWFCHPLKGASHGAHATGTGGGTTKELPGAGAAFPAAKPPLVSLQIKQTKK